MNKMLAHCFNPQLAQGACAVFRLASMAVNQNQARFKYRFCSVSEFENVVFVRLITILYFKICSLFKVYFWGLLSQAWAI